MMGDYEEIREQGSGGQSSVLLSFLAGFFRLLNERIILVLMLMLCAGVAGVLWDLSRLSSNLIKSAALQDAVRYSQAVTEFRALYASEVVARVKDSGIEVTHDYSKKKGPSPFRRHLAWHWASGSAKRVPGRSSGCTVLTRFPGGEKRAACRMNLERKRGII